MNKYEHIRVLGQGGYGKAILVKRRSDGKFFVVKEVRLTALSPHDREEASKEAKVLSSLHSPFIVSFEESFQERGCFYIVMEYADGGDLSQKIQSRGNHLFTEEEVLKDFIQLLLAIKYIHDRRILHRDLKAQNVFIMRDGTIKLGDFGIARVLERTFQLCHTQIGSPYYLSPEICEGRPYNSKTDIWSLGCILYELCTLRHAFNAVNMNALLMNIVMGKFNPIPPTFSKELRQLISRMLTKDANLRPSINAVLATPIIRSRLKKFYDDFLLSSSQNSPSRPKAQIYRPKILRGVGGQMGIAEQAENLEIVLNSKVENMSAEDKNAKEVESIIMQNRENRKKQNQNKQSPQNAQNKQNFQKSSRRIVNIGSEISPEKASEVIYGKNTISISTNDSCMSQLEKNKPDWAKLGSKNQRPKRIEIINEDTVNESEEASSKMKIKKSFSSPDSILNLSKPKNNGPQIINQISGRGGAENIPSHQSRSSLALLNSSRNQTSTKKSAKFFSPPMNMKTSAREKSSLSPPSPHLPKRSASKVSMSNSGYSGVSDEDFERIFGFQKKETEMNTKKLKELESRQKKLEKPVLPFVDDINRRKIQLQRAEIENKRARMRQLQNKKNDDDRLIQEIMQELDNDPILQAAERSVRERCGAYNNQIGHQKVSVKSPSHNHVKMKSPQESVSDAHFHLQSIQCLASSIRDALLLTEDDENDTSFVDTSSPSPLLQSQSTSLFDEKNNNLDNENFDQKHRRRSLNEPKIDLNEDAQTENKDESGKFYLNGRELKFPVVSDSDSLSYRAEAIRAFLERELGIDKLLDIRQKVVDPSSFDLEFEDVEPGLIILIQQLVILDEKIFNQ